MAVLGCAIALHSYKGGTGKTSIASNLAVILAKDGLNVCIMDHDFRAPSLHLIFQEKPSRWVGEFLDGKRAIEEVLVDLSTKFSTKGRLMAAFADPSTDAMREMMVKDRRWETAALHRILQAKMTVFNELRMDYVIYDTGPGMQFSAANALAVSDLIAVVTKVDKFDLEGTEEMMQGLYDALGKKVGIIVNKVVGKEAYDTDLKEKLRASLEDKFDARILGVIPCFCDVQMAGTLTVYAVSQPEHVFVKVLRDISAMIIRACGE